MNTAVQAENLQSDFQAIIQESNAVQELQRVLSYYLEEKQRNRNASGVGSGFYEILQTSRGIKVVVHYQDINERIERKKEPVEPSEYYFSDIEELQFYLRN